jgi:signal transduction histidine kinase
LARPRFETGEFIEIVIADAPLKRDMTVYAWRMLRSSLIMSLIVGGLLYGALHVLFVRPMRKLTSQIEQFGARPADITAAIQPSGRADEIGRAERALAAMETDVRSALRQRERLAGLGAAVAKLAHDLRNSLATASLVTERLAESDDPRVKQTAPRLVRALARAGALAEAALRYGRAEEPAPQLEFLALRDVLDDAAADALDAYPLVAWRNRAPDDLKINIDPEHAHRIFSNLMRNAAQAMGPSGGALEARLARRDDQLAVTELADTGPGLPKAALERLFEPFAGRANNGAPAGAGLGLSIARELARGMGGDLDLVSSSSKGAVFAIALRVAPALAKAP